jgi:class 3 adenylate cyclase/tetratricopeptide (TPR) repeat protein
MDRPSTWAIEGRKTVTVVFCDVVAFTQLADELDPEALRHVMGQVFERSEAVVERHGGIVEKFAGDEVMAIFGVPTIHEDDALRAVRTAVAMRESIAEIERGLGSGAQLEVRIGVNTGEVAVSDPSAGHSFVSGDAIAVGKRLEQAAEPGEILLGEATHKLVAHAVESDELDPLSLKGLSRMTTAFRLRAVDAEATAIPRRSDTAVTGRTGELGRLLGFYADAAKGEGRFVTVLGEPGIGKSRLARELFANVENEATVLIGRCPPYGEGTTFSPVREVFTTAGRDDAELDGSSYEVFTATRRLVEELAYERPVVVALDDLHWAAETLLDLVEHLSARLGSARVLLLCLARPDLADRRPSWLRDAACVTLEPLSETDSRRLLEALGAPPAVHARIAEMAEGNPLFMEQLAAFASEESDSVELVGSIRGVLHARLDKLGRGERAVLERAAVAGRSFTLEAVLGLTAPEEREHAQAHLFDLARRDLIRPDITIPDEGFRFQHALIREVVYESMPKAARAGLHLQTAALLEAAGGEDALVGFHLERAFQLNRELANPQPELGARAGALLRRAAQETFNRSDVPASISLLERARLLLPDGDPALPELLTEIGYARLSGGDMPAAETVLDEAIERAVALGQRSAELHARTEREFVRMFVSGNASLDSSVAFAREAMAELGQPGDELALARAWWLSSSGDVRACRWRERGEALERALVYAREANVGLDVAGTLSGLYAQALLHGPTPAEAALARVQELLDEIGSDPVLQSAVRPSVAGLLAMQGEFDEARANYRSAVTTYDDLGLRFRRMLQAFVGAQIELWAGDPEAAAAKLRASSTAFDEFGAGNSAVTHRALLAVALCAAGREDEAEAVAAVVTAAASPDDIVPQVLWRSAACRVLARRGDAEGSAGLAAEALTLTEDVEFPFLQATALTAAAEAEAVSGRPVEARRLLEDARTLMAEKGNLPEVARLTELAETYTGPPVA